MIREIYLVHHSHTDIGYTHPQPVVMELHRRFIDRALDDIDRTRDWPEDSRFRWTCEVSGVTLDWWQRASQRDRARFLRAVQDGQLEVAGLAWNMTPLMDHEMLLEVLEPVQFFRELGVPVRSAMNSDVNGWPWGTVEALLDHGITGFSMAINPHFGYAPMPRPRGFWWEGASGRKLLVHNGLQYGIGAQFVLRVPASLEEARTAIPAYAQHLEARGHSQGFVMMQVTNPILYDNAGPVLKLSAFVRAWNDEGHEIRLRVAALSEVFDRLRREPPEHLESLRGDWTDWWNFGAGSTALQTALSLEGQRALREAQQLRAWPGVGFPRDEALVSAAKRALQLYAEHTWGADRSIWKAGSIETRIQQDLKLVTASEGASLARMLRRDGLERLAKLAGGTELTMLVYNPLPFPVARSLRVPKIDEHLEPFATDEAQAIQRQDVILGDMTTQLKSGSWHTPVETHWVGPLELPALGYVALPYASLPASTAGLVADKDSIGNGRINVQFDLERGGVRSFSLDGTEFARHGEFGFGQVVLERPEGNQRQEIYGPPAWDSPETVHLRWHPDWKARREGPVRLLESRRIVHAGCVEFVQLLEMSTGDRATNHYRIFPGELSLELEVVLDKVGLDDPHALYVSFPLEMDGAARCHFETAGAVVELDREQLPNTSKHYLTTQRFIRLQDDHRGLTVACPDTPLWQVGGFTFGRHAMGEVERGDAMLVGWLTNNYWDTNFQADQSGPIRQTFRLIPHAAEGLETSIRRALPYAVSPQLHWYKDRGPSRRERAQLLDLELNGVMLTGLEHDGSGVKLRLLNPTDAPLKVQIRDGWLKLRSAHRANLAGTTGEALPVSNGELQFEIEARAWTGVSLELSST